MSKEEERGKEEGDPNSPKDISQGTTLNCTPP